MNVDLIEPASIENPIFDVPIARIGIAARPVLGSPESGRLKPPIRARLRYLVKQLAQRLLLRMMAGLLVRIVEAA
jgi:hypothetical protein